jgi:hypothetical protein
MICRSVPVAAAVPVSSVTFHMEEEEEEEEESG